MFTRGLPILSGSAMDPGNIPVPRLPDAQKSSCQQAVQRAMTAEIETMTAGARTAAPEAYRALQWKRRHMLEAFLYVDPTREAFPRMIDLIDRIAAEDSWGMGGALFDDPAHPVIDLQAAETGMLFAWLLRCHGARLAEICPTLPGAMQAQLRRRLLSPIQAHDDYPYMRGEGVCPMLIAADLLLTCLLTESASSRRIGPVKLLLRSLDALTTLVPEGPLTERLADACAAADLARLLKRLTRGEFDLTARVPAAAQLDDVLLAWISDEYFLDPAGAGLKPAVSGMDYFRLGYLSRDHALTALGAELNRMRMREPFSLNGRVLSQEYRRAADDECSAPPRLRRAVSENGTLMLSRSDGLFAALCAGSGRANAGALTLFCDAEPILVDAEPGASLFSVPAIGGRTQLARPRYPVQPDYDFGADKELMSVELTHAYPEAAGLQAYSRTLMTLHGQESVRVVDAFEFTQPQCVEFSFITAQRPIPLRGCVRIGSVSLSWDGEMKPLVEEIDAAGAALSPLFRLSLRADEPPRRFICGFTFERS